MMFMLPSIINSDTSLEELSIYFRIFHDVSKDDEDYTSVKMSDDISDELCEELNIKQNLTFDQLTSALRIKGFSKDSIFP